MKLKTLLIAVTVATVPALSSLAATSCVTAPSPALAAMPTPAPPTDASDPSVSPTASPLVSRFVGKSRESLSAPKISFLETWADALSLLPLDDLDQVEMTDESLTLHFDFDGEAHKDIVLGGTTSVVLKPGRRGLDLETGRVSRSKSDGRKIRIKKKVRLSIDLDLGIKGVAEQDLSLYAWMKRRSVSISTTETPLKIAENGDGRPILHEATPGKAMRRDRQLVPKAFRRWMKIECSGRSFEFGLGKPEDGRALARHWS